MLSTIAVENYAQFMRKHSSPCAKWLIAKFAIWLVHSLTAGASRFAVQNCFSLVIPSKAGLTVR